MDYTNITKYLQSIFVNDDMPELTADNVVEVLTDTRNKLATVIMKVEALVAMGDRPLFNINIEEAKRFLRIVDDALELVKSGIIDSKKLLEFIAMPLPAGPSLVNVSPEMAAAIGMAETTRLKLEKENQFLASAMVVLNILMKLIPMIAGAAILL